MDKVILKTKDPQLTQMVLETMKAGYEAVTEIAIEDAGQACRADDSIHGLFADRDLITREQAAAFRQTVGNPLFPLIIFADAMSEAEMDAWMAAGVTEILVRPFSEALLGRRIDNVVRLYCMSRSLASQAFDRLTGLRMRQSFYHFAQEMILEQPQAEYTIIISDIENFKLINERFGEAKGDELLRFVGHSLAAANGPDILFGRYSGDQFVGIIRRQHPDEGQDEAPLVNGMGMMYAAAPIEHFLVKFGIYDNVDKSLPVSIMCDRAMMALRTIKHQYGRTLAKYNAQMQQRFNREQQILDSMEEAIAREQFMVYYQPKHAAGTSELVGVEALVRWEHPSYGFMSPGEFIPLFERNGFISQLDKYVWNRVCRDVREWMDSGLPVVPVSVNASRRDILQDNFVEVVRQPLEKYGVDPKYFHMEVTESIYMEDAQILAPIIRRVKDMGIEIELDDFGSGFSSLGLLSKLPLDVIKLDISLTRSLDEQPVMVEGIIRLMHSLGYRVIAEGVETDEQLEAITAMGCDWIQGYYYSKPLTVSGLRDYMQLYKTL